jgi:DNA-binding NarL/FixJ family response regulator
MVLLGAVSAFLVPSSRGDRDRESAACGDSRSRAAVLHEYATPREWQLEQLWLQGVAPKQIARLLGI